MNPAQPATGSVVCTLEDIPEPGAKGFRYQVGDAMFSGFVVRKEGQVFGYVDSCPHAGWPLPIGGRYLTREHDRILCGGHGALFTIEDGMCVAGPCYGRRLLQWPVRIKGGEVVAGWA